MLLSALINVTPTLPSPIICSLGRPIQAWFLNQITSQNAEFGEELHDLGGAKPYTVSSLLDARGRLFPEGKWIQPGDSLWLRITSVDSKLSEFILEKFLPNLPQRIQLYKIQLRIEGWTLDAHQHPWARQTSYQDISVASAPGGNNVRMEFLSPTAFRSSGLDIPLPIPRRIFTGLYTKWNRFTPYALNIDNTWPDFVDNCIVVSVLTTLNTTRWKFAEGTRGAATGFTGTVGFNLIPQNKSKEWAICWNGADQVMQSLAQFAFYSGVGHHTTIGMGQTRLLNNPK